MEKDIHKSVSEQMKKTLAKARWKVPGSRFFLPGVSLSVCLSVRLSVSVCQSVSVCLSLGLSLSLSPRFTSLSLSSLSPRFACLPPSPPSSRSLSLSLPLYQSLPLSFYLSPFFLASLSLFLSFSLPLSVTRQHKHAELKACWQLVFFCPSLLTSLFLSFSVSVLNAHAVRPDFFGKRHMLECLGQRQRCVPLHSDTTRMPNVQWPRDGVGVNLVPSA